MSAFVFRRLQFSADLRLFLSSVFCWYLSGLLFFDFFKIYIFAVVFGEYLFLFFACSRVDVAIFIVRRRVTAPRRIVAILERIVVV
ncbi:membrane protein [gut metagenome]|uniref:Membrane protein n=1 Tax=gut metagenome TaxID=749906 RepID=J9H554_9ZZZZ